MADFTSFITGGQSENVEKTEQVYDVQEDIIEARAYAMDKSGQYSTSEITSFVTDANKQNDKYRDEAVTSARNSAIAAGALNAVGLTTSAILTGGSVHASVIKNGAKSAIKEGAETLTPKALNKAANNATTSVIKNIGKETAEEVVVNGVKLDIVPKIFGSNKILTTAQKGVLTTGNIINRTSSGIGRFVGVITHKNIGTIATYGVRGAMCTSPLIATQMITRGQATKDGKALDQTLDSLNNRLAYIQKNGDQLGEDFKNVCGEWADKYAESTAILLDQYEKNEISQADYDERMKELAETYDSQYEEMKKEFPEYLAQAEFEDSATYIAQKGYDIDAMIQKSSMYREDCKKHPEIVSNVEEYADNKYGTAETGFGNFWKTLNSTIVKYAPAVAYVEATILKAADSAFDFIRDAVRGVDVESKYQYDTIDSLAQSIIDHSDEHLEARAKAIEAYNGIKETCGEMTDEMNMQSAEKQMAQVSGADEAQMDTIQDPVLG